MNMINVQFNARDYGGASTTGAALEIIPLQHAPAETKGWIASRFVLAANSGFNLTF